MKLLFLLLIFLFIECQEDRGVFEELFTLDCNRRLHLFPNSPLATGVDLEGYLSIVNKGYDEMHSQSKSMCPDLSDEDFNSRFGFSIPSGFVRLFENDEFDSVADACEYSFYNEIPILYNYLSTILPEDPLPPSCSASAAMNGECLVEVDFNPFQFQVAIKECPTFGDESYYNRIPFISVVCEGCDTLMKPCSNSSDCGPDEKCGYWYDIVNTTRTWVKNIVPEEIFDVLDGIPLFQQPDALHFMPETTSFDEFGFYDDLLRWHMSPIDLVNNFMNYITTEYWGSPLSGVYNDFRFCVPDVELRSDFFFSLYDLSDCEGGSNSDTWYCRNETGGDLVFWADPGVCNAHGYCYEGDCHCKLGYTGTFCETVENEDVEVTCDGLSGTYACSGNGNCTSQDVCECFEYWSGEWCDVYTNCGSLDCGEHGNCVSTSCECDVGYYTTDETSNLRCDGLLYCDGDGDCSGNGDCLDQGDHTGVGVCSCYDRYFGSDCSDYLVCPDNGGYAFAYEGVDLCGDFGDCELNPDQPYSQLGICVCEDYVYGDECEDDTRYCNGYWYLDDEVCNGHGDCEYSERDEEFMCVCDDGYDGFTCSAAECYTTANGVCNGHGICVKDFNCECDYPYTGSVCTSLVTCDGVPYYDDEGNRNVQCSGHGICLKSGVCLCEDSWGGANCSELISCDGIPVDDPTVCGGVYTCTSSGCAPDVSALVDPEDGECAEAILGMLLDYDGVMPNGEWIDSDVRMEGTNFDTQINRIRYVYDSSKPFPLISYNADGVFHVLPSHPYLGFSVFFKDLDKLLYKLDALFQDFRKYFRPIELIRQQYYYQFWTPLPYLFRLTSFDQGNRLGFRHGRYHGRYFRLFRNYELPYWFRKLNFPMTCGVDRYNEHGNCTMKFSGLSHNVYEGELIFYVKLKSDTKDSSEDYTGIPKIDVFAGGEMAHQLYALQLCQEDSDCASEHAQCEVWKQVVDYTDEETYLTPFTIYEVTEDDDTTYVYSFYNLSTLPFDTSSFSMEFSLARNPLVFYRNLIGFISGVDLEPLEDEDELDALAFCSLKPIESGSSSGDEDEENDHRHHRFHRRFFGGWRRWWKKWTKRVQKRTRNVRITTRLGQLRQWWEDIVGDWWDSFEEQWKKFFSKRRGGGRWRQRNRNHNNNNDDDEDEGEEDDEEVEEEIEALEIEGLEEWDYTEYCMVPATKAKTSTSEEEEEEEEEEESAVDCGCKSINCVCYVPSEGESCEKEYVSPQETIVVLPGVKAVQTLLESEGMSEVTAAILVSIVLITCCAFGLCVALCFIFFGSMVFIKTPKKTQKS